MSLVKKLTQATGIVIGGPTPTVFKYLACPLRFLQQHRNLLEIVKSPVGIVCQFLLGYLKINIW
jgi:hypothetical protein